MTRPWTTTAVLLVVASSALGLVAGVTLAFGAYFGLQPNLMFSATRHALPDRILGSGGLCLLGCALLTPLGLWVTAWWRRSSRCAAVAGLVAVPIVATGLVWAVQA